jgi:hypothetical protein
LFGFNHWLSLTGSKSTETDAPPPSPEQLLHERLDAGDFDGALQLASQYDLNRDLVYELQWTNSAVDQLSIDSFLAQVQDTHWALDQCTTRLGDDVCSNEALLEHGLQLTELRHVLPSDPNDVSVDSLHELPYEEYTKQVQQLIEDKKRRLLAEVIEQPSARQQFLLTARLKLLRHKQLLLLYEQICNELQQPFEASEYDRFRCRPLLESAIQLANEAQWKALRILFTYTGNDLLPHRLVILSHVPETVSPFNYQALLPQCPPDQKEQHSYPWEQAQLLKVDWVWEHFKSIDPAIQADSEFECQLYADHPQLLAFKCDMIPTKSQLTIWYKWRARQIESLSGLVSNALALLAIGIRQNVPDLESLRDDLHTFETLVYELFPSRPNLNQSLEQFERLPLQAKLELLMTGCTEQPQHFLRVVQQNLIPFLNRYVPGNVRMQEKLLHDFLLSTVTNNIVLLGNYLKQLQQLSPNDSNQLLTNAHLLKTVTMSALYGNLTAEQLLLAQQILESIELLLNKANQSNEDTDTEDIAELKAKLSASKLLHKHHNFLNPRQLRDLNDSTALTDRPIQLFTNVMKKAINTRSVQKSQWDQLMTDVQELRRLLFSHLFNHKQILELSVRTLLTSNFQGNIDVACDFFDFGFKSEVKSDIEAGCEGWDLDEDDLESSSSSSEFKRDHDLSSNLTTSNLIDQDKAICMLITAAVDYLCAADSIKDRSADLATHCLGKIPVKFHSRDDVRAEFDFVAAMNLLHAHFDVRLLPVQLRLMPYPKLDAVKAAAASIAKGHQKLDSLLQLAKLLRVYEGRPNDYRDTHVLLLSGDMAFDLADYTHCVSCCRFLINRKLVAGWKLCQRLGSCDRFNDLHTRLQLLSFAVANCDEDGAQLQLLLDQLRKLKLRLNQRSTDQGVSRLLASKTSHVSDHIRQRTQHVAKATGQLAGWLLRNLMPEELNENEHEQLEQLAAEQQYESELASKHYSAAQFANSLVIPSFYESAFASVHRLVQLQRHESSGFHLPDVESESSADCGKSRPLPVAQLLLRTSMLSETRACRRRVETLLRQLSRSALQHDTPLALAYLFSVTDVRQGQRVFAPLAQCPELLLSVAEYSVCVRLGQVQPEPLSLYEQSIDGAIKIAGTLAKTTTTKTERDCHILLSQYANRRQQVHKADRVRKMCPDVPTERFLNDASYRRETLLGLALTDCEQTLSSVVSLALEFHVPLFDVYLAHTEHLLTDTGLSAEQLRTRLFDNLELFSALLEQNEATTDAFERRVRPLLSGLDYERLSVYFEVLLRINGDDPLCSSRFARHSTNLQALTRTLSQSAGERLDYLRLLDKRQTPFELIFAILDESNHLRIAKCLQSLDLDLEPPLTASAVHSLWLRKLLLSPANERWTRSLFVQVWPTIRRLLPNDLRLFAAFLTLSPEADRRQLPSEDRRYALNQMIRQVTRKVEKSDDQLEEWRDCRLELERTLDSLSKSQ